MLEELPVSASELNTLLLIVGIPLVSYVGKRIISTLGRLDKTVSTLHVMLLGTEEQGGLVRRVEGIARQGHDHANDITTLKAQMSEVMENRRVLIRRAVDRKS